MQWTLKDKKTVLTAIPFSVEELDLAPKTNPEQKVHPYHRLSCPDWVNVLPITSDHQAILIRQSRTGSWRVELETPGGVMDEKDPTLAAQRELEEETGYSSQRFLSLGSLSPNPALFDNRLHMFLALGCELVHHRQYYPDEHEDISLELVDVKELDSLVRLGRINSCLACLTICLAQPYLKKDALK